jgi:hypothetical protein
VLNEKPMKNTMKKEIILFYLFILIYSVGMKSQTKIEKYSISSKLTLDLLSDEFYSEGIELNALSKSYIYSFGYYYGEDYEFLGNSPTEKYNQVNLLFGKYIDTKNEKFRFQYQVGIGVFWGTIRTNELDTTNSNFFGKNYFTQKITTVGIPLKIGSRYIPFKFLSIGIDLQGNLNFKKPIIRPMLSIEFGKMRN